MNVSVVIPCYNESATIESVIQSVLGAIGNNDEIIVVDDYSTDGTREYLAKNFPSGQIRIVLQEMNRGKGAALRAGFEVARNEIVLIQDADLEYDPRDYPILIEPIVQDKADVVYGSRFHGSQPHRVLYFWHRMGNGFLTLLSNMFTNLNLTDMETGYKVFRREILDSLEIEEDGFGFEPEITAKVSKARCRIYEVGIGYYGRTYAEGKKIGWKDGVHAIWCILKYNLGR